MVEMARVAGFEPAVSRSQSERDDQTSLHPCIASCARWLPVMDLNHAREGQGLASYRLDEPGMYGARGEIRTHHLLVKSEVLFPVSFASARKLVDEERLELSRAKLAAF